MSDIKKIKIIGYIAMIVSFAFIIKVVLSMNIDYSYIKSPAWALIVGVGLSLILVINCYISAYCWKSIVEFFDNKKRKLPFLPILNVYAKSNIAKYLPGNVMQFAGRNVLGSQLGISQFAMLSGTVIEVLSLVMTGFILVVIFFNKNFVQVYEYISSNRSYRIVFYIVVVVGVVCVIAGCIFLTKSSKYYEIVKRAFSISFLKIMLKLLLAYAYSFIVMSFVFYCSFIYIMDVNVNFSLVISAAIISWIVGYVVPGAPGGMGIREVVLLFLLGNVYGEGVAMMGAIVFRIVSIIGDIIAFALDLIIAKCFTKKEGK